MEDEIIACAKCGYVTDNWYVPEKGLKYCPFCYGSELRMMKRAEAYAISERYVDSMCGPTHDEGKVRNLRRITGELGWTFDVIEPPGVEWPHGRVRHCFTDRYGTGLFEQLEDGSVSCISGTCQFYLTQKTASGARRYIKKYFGLQ